VSDCVILESDMAVGIAGVWELGLEFGIGIALHNPRFLEYMGYF
jgi:hypothetical protein